MNLKSEDRVNIFESLPETVQNSTTEDYALSPDNQTGIQDLGDQVAKKFELTKNLNEMSMENLDIDLVVSERRPVEKIFKNHPY